MTTPARAGQYHAVHFGIFVEELRHGATQASAFRDIFETRSLQILAREVLPAFKS